MKFYFKSTVLVAISMLSLNLKSTWIGMPGVVDYNINSGSIYPLGNNGHLINSYYNQWLLPRAHQYPYYSNSQFYPRNPFLGEVSTATPNIYNIGLNYHNTNPFSADLNSGGALGPCHPSVCMSGYVIGY